MSATVVNQGETRALADLLAGPLKVRLFQNDLPFVPSSVFGDFLAATFPGYVDQVLAGTLSPPAINPLGQAASVSAPVSWVRATSGPPQTVYGYLVYWNDLAGNILFAGERFAVPRTLTAAGDSITLQIQFLLQQF